MLFIYMLIAIAQLRLRAKFEAEAPERLQIRMWFHPYGTWGAIAGMAGVLILMGLSKDHAVELWTSVLVTALFMVGFWIRKSADRTATG
jgi:GABA permease